MPRDRGTVAGIQYLRGLAAIFVVLIHGNGMMGYPEYFGASVIAFERLGAFGVSIFFVISGVIITIVTMNPDLTPRLDRRGFAIRRFNRIIPFMLVCVLGYNLLTFIGTRQVEWGPFLRALVLWPVGELKPNVLWTLRQELLFYTVFALLMLGGRRRLVLIGLWFLLPLPMALALDINPQLLSQMHPWLADFINIFTLEGFAHLLFGAGFLIGVLWLKHRDAISGRIGGGFCLIVAVAVAGAFLNQATYDSGPGQLIDGLVQTLLAAATVMVGIVARPSAGWLGSLGERLGDASYSIYLVHNAVLLALLELSRRIDIVAPLPVVWLSFTLVAICVGIAIHYWVEVPLVRYVGRRSSPASPTGRPRTA